jgi:type I restriction enzyme, S subunit
MKQVDLIDICNPKQWKTISTSDLLDEGYPVYGANGKIGFYSEYTHEFPTVLITCRGATCGVINICEPKSYVNGNAMALDELDSSVDLMYLFYVLSFRGFDDAISGSAQPQITRQNLKNVKIPLPSLREQQKIAAILKAADSLRQKDQQLIERYIALSQSLFLEMFGDPVTNPMGWKAVLLEEISDIASGVTKGRKLTSDEVIDIPYMRVANVQDGYLDLNEIKYIPGSKVDLEKYILKNGDLLLTEGGDPDKLGRGAVWSGEIKNCIHQNHIFRVRLTSHSHIPIYLSKLCGSEYGKRYFIKSGKQTTGIASINKTQLRRFPVLCPPIALQTQFAERIQLIEAQKQQAMHSLEKSEALFNSLLQRAFTGELTAKVAA